MYFWPSNHGTFWLIKVTNCQLDHLLMKPSFFWFDLCHMSWLYYIFEGDMASYFAKSRYVNTSVGNVYGFRNTHHVSVSVKSCKLILNRVKLDKCKCKWFTLVHHVNQNKSLIFFWKNKIHVKKCLHGPKKIETCQKKTQWCVVCENECPKFKIQNPKIKQRLPNLFGTLLRGTQLPQEIQKQEHLKVPLLAPQTFPHLLIPHMGHPANFKWAKLTNINYLHQGSINNPYNRRKHVLSLSNYQVCPILFL